MRVKIGANHVVDFAVDGVRIFVLVPGRTWDGTEWDVEFKGEKLDIPGGSLVQREALQNPFRPDGKFGAEGAYLCVVEAVSDNGGGILFAFFISSDEGEMEFWQV